MSSSGRINPKIVGVNHGIAHSSCENSVQNVGFHRHDSFEEKMQITDRVDCSFERRELFGKEREGDQVTLGSPKTKLLIFLLQVIGVHEKREWKILRR